MPTRGRSCVLLEVELGLACIDGGIAERGRACLSMVVAVVVEVAALAHRLHMLATLRLVTQVRDRENNVRSGAICRCAVMIGAPASMSAPTLALTFAPASGAGESDVPRELGPVSAVATPILGAYRTHVHTSTNLTSTPYLRAHAVAAARLPANSCG